MQNRQLKRFIYHLQNDYLTMNNVVLAVALMIAFSWAWSSVQAVQRNYALQRSVDDKKRQQQLLQLETENLQFEQRYYKSHEYLNLEAKRRLGLADPGERVLILPTNSPQIKALDEAEQRSSSIAPVAAPPPPPFTQWMEFLSGVKPQG